MDLKAAVNRYLEVVGQFRRPMPLSRFELDKEELEAMVSAWDEDYHLHRHFELIAAPARAPEDPAEATAYLIHGFAYTAIVFQESIRHVFDDPD